VCCSSRQALRAASIWAVVRGDAEARAVFCEVKSILTECSVVVSVQRFLAMFLRLLIVDILEESFDLFQETAS